MSNAYNTFSVRDGMETVSQVLTLWLWIVSTVWITKVFIGDQFIFISLSLTKVLSMTDTVEHGLK